MEDKILEARKALYNDLGEVYKKSGHEIPDFDTFNKLFGENKDFQKAVYDDIDYKSFDVSYEDYERVMGLGVDGTQEEEVKPVTEGKQEEVSLSDSKDSSGQSLEQLESSRPQVVAGENVFLQEGEELISGETEEGAYLAIRQPDGEYSNVLEPVEVTATRNIETAEADEDTADWVNTTFGSRLKNSIMASVSDFNTGLATTPEFLYGLGSVAFNALADGLDKIQEGLGDSVRIDPEAGYEYLASGRYNPLRLLMEYADSQKDNAEYHNTQLPEDFHSIETSLVNGDFLRAGEQLLTSVVSSAPSLVYLSMTGGAGAGQTVTRTAMQTAQRTLGRTALVTLPFSASEYQRELGNEDSQMNPTLRPVYALLSGMSEILDAEIGASSIIRGQIANKTTGVKQVAELATGYVEKALAKEGIPRYVFNGAVSEGTIRFTQNVISKYSGSNPDLDLKDGIFDSILVGGALSGSVATKTHVTNRIVKSLSDARLKKKLDRIESLRKEVESATRPEVAEVLQDRMESVVSEINAETDALDIEGRISRLSEEDVNRLTELDEEAIRIENALNDDSNLSQETSTVLEERLSEIDRESTEILNKDSQESLTDSEVETVTEGEIVSETAELNTVTEVSSESSDVANSQGTVETEVPAGSRLFSQPVEGLTELSNSYKEANNVSTPEGQPIRQLDRDRSVRIADAYEAMEHNPNDPEVKSSYEAMATETLQQFETIQKAGYTVELWDGEGEPYANSTAMLEDLRNNKHLYVLPTEAEFGETPITDQQRQENPLLRDSGITDANGRRMLINDVFRFVHDVFGHGERGNSFGPLGEENAWDVHARMYSDTARRAMTTETRGQNSWVNFGPHLRNAEGQVPRRGEEGFTPATERPFAEQKIGLLPEEFSQLEPVQEQAGQTETPSDTTTEVEADSTIFENVFDDSKRQSRISELEASLKQQFEDAKKLGIKSDPREKAQEDLKFLRDLTEYAVLKIADGTVNTVQAFHDIAKNIGDFGKEVLDRAYYDAVESAKSYIESNPEVSRSELAQGEVLTRLQDPNLDRRPSETKVTKKQIRESTESKIKGEKVSMTPKQALANQIRTLNRGARDAIKSVRDIQGRLREYIGNSTKGKAGMKFTAGEYRGLARLFQGVHNEETLDKALTLVDKSIDKADFRKKLASINTNQRAVKRKNLPVSQKKVAREFANINPRDFMPFEDGSDNSPLNRYLDMLEDLNKSGIKKSNVSNVMMEQMINFAQQGREILDLEAEVKRNQAEAKPETLTDKEKSRKVGGLKTRLKNLGMSDADITKVITEAGNIDAQIEALNAEVDSRKIDGLKKQLKELGMDDSEIATIVDSGKELSQIIKELTDKIDEIKPSRLDVIKETSQKLVEELNNRVDEIADSMTEFDAREFRAFVESINLKNLPDKYFLPLNYVLNNLVNNNSISGILTFRNIFNSVNKLNDTKRVKSIMDNFREVSELKWLRNLGFKGNINSDDARKFFLSTLYTRIEAIIKDTNFVGATHDFFGFSNYDAGSKIVKDRLNDVKGGVADILSKYNKIDPNYWKDSYNTSMASAYAILAQYKDTWTPERVQAEFNGRLEALVESYDRMREYTQNLKAIPQDAVNQLETLGRIVSELAVVEREADGSIKEVTGKKNLDEIWASLPEGYQEYYNYTRDFFEGIKEEFFTVQRMIGKEDVDTSWKNYFPLSYTDLRETIFGRGKGSSDVDLTELVGGNMRNTTTPLSSAGKDRVIVGKLLPKGQGLNLDLLTNFELEAGKALSDIYTLPQAYEINLMTDVINNGMSDMGYDVSPILTYRNIMHDRLSADHEMIQRMGVVPNNSLAGKFGKFLSDMGMVRTLGGWSQFIKQSTILSEVLGRLKNKSTLLTAMNIIAKGKNIEDVNRILGASDLSLRNRQEHLFSIKDDIASLSKEVNKQQRNIINSLGRNYRNAFDKASKFSLKPLIGTDNYMAKVGWLAMYLDHMQTQGYSIQEALASEVNSEALSKANHSNSVVQNASDASMQGNYASSLFKMYQPMMGFSLNSWHNFAISTSKFTDAVKQGDNENILRYGTEMAMNMTNAALFVWLSRFARRVGTLGAEFGTELYVKLFVDDEEDRKKLLLDEISKEFDRRDLADRARTWNYMFNDFLFRGIFSDATIGIVGAVTDQIAFQETLYGKEELEQAGYSTGRFRSSNTPFLGFMEQWLPILGVRGMGLASMATAFDNVQGLFDTHEKYIRDTRGVPYADGSGIHVDLGLLDEEGISDFGIPEYLRASQYFAGTAGLISLFGASDQTIGTMVRNVKNVTRKVAEKERGRRRTGDWEKTLMKDVASFHSVDVGGVKVELTPQEAREAREAYLDLVEYNYEQLYRFDDKLSQSLIEEEVAQISRESIEAGIISNKTDELVKGSLDSVEDELKELNAFKRSIKLQVDADKRRIARERREKQKRKRRNDPLGERR